MKHILIILFILLNISCGKEGAISTNGNNSYSYRSEIIDNEFCFDCLYFSFNKNKLNFFFNKEVNNCSGIKILVLEQDFYIPNKNTQSVFFDIIQENADINTQNQLFDCLGGDIDLEVFNDGEYLILFFNNYTIYLKEI